MSKKQFSPEGLETVTKIKNLTERKGWTQGQTAEYLGVPLSTLANWMQLTREPTASVARLVYVLGLIEALSPGLHKTLTPEKPTAQVEEEVSDGEESVM